MQVPEEMKRTQIHVENKLRKFFQEKRAVARAIDPSCEMLVEQIADLALRPSKRVRPFLLWLGYQTHHTAHPSPLHPSPNVLSAMLAVELFHTFALIHDDIMDEDKERRGGPTIHAQAGINIAILAGDLALVWADECMNKTGHGKAIELFSRMKEEIAYGQTLDLMKQAGNKNIAQEKINEMKTAWYTIVRPLQIGAAISGAAEKTLTVLAGYGVPVGKLFQLKDDLMDKEVTQEAFHREVPKLEKAAYAALGELQTKGETRRIFRELVRFVSKRRA